MAIALVDHAVVAGLNATSVTTAAIDTTGASLLVAMVHGHGGTFSISDSKSNTWTLAQSISVSGARSNLYYVANPTVGSGHTFTGGSSVGTSSLYAAAFSGVSTSSPIDINDSNSDFGVTSLNLGSTHTPSQNNEVILSCLLATAGTLIGVDSGLALIDSMNGSGSNNYGGGWAYIVQTTAGGVDPTWSWTVATNASTTLASFTAPSTAHPRSYGTIIS